MQSSKLQHYRTRIIVAFVLLGLLSLGYVFFVSPIVALYRDGQEVARIGQDLQQGWDERDLERMESDLASLSASLETVANRLHGLGYLGWLPLVNSYYEDATNLVTAGTILSQAGQQIVADIEPYAGVLGFRTGDTGDPVADVQLQQIIKVLPQLMSTADAVIEASGRAGPFLSGMHAEKYPERISVSGVEYPVREYVRQVVRLAKFVEENSADVSAVVHLLPEMMGVSEAQSYLVLFQNDKELRPTGGFITSFAMIKIEAGEVTISDARNIYEVSTEEAYLAPPGPIVTYLKQPLWRMRDTNFSPDFKESMGIFTYYWDTLRLPEYAGVVALDTQFVAALLERLGPVTVTDYSYDFSDFYNLPAECQTGGESFTHENVVCRLEVYAQRLSLNQFQRKAVIGDLMEKIFEKVMGLPADDLFPLAQEMYDLFQRKHILAYLKEIEGQSLIEKYNLGGRIQDFDGDYLHVNDANLAGLKSDMYLKRSVSQVYEIGESGEIVKRVKLIYENTGAFDGWLNATARNYVRVYVPEGAELINIAGGEAQTTQFNELGKTVFDNFLLISPLAVREIEFTYKLPFAYQDGLELLIQKQPGVETTYHTVEMDGRVQELELTTDRNVQL